jgi:predicted nucleotidyltransferase component of viral defense system
MNVDLEKSIKAKLRQIAKFENKTPSVILQNFFLERFLVRIAYSSYCDNFVLKGGLLLSKYLNIGRQTQDLDFFAKNIKNQTQVIEKVFQEIARIEIADGIIFKDIRADSLLHPHMNYLGAQISMFGYFGNIRCKLSIDLGFGDVVKEVKKELFLMKSAKGPLFENSIKLNCYPCEFIFAEKLETIIFRGAANSRMKDFYDVYIMILDDKDIQKEVLENAVIEVFNHRKTPLNIPISFSDDEFYYLEVYWKSFYQGLNLKAINYSIPEKIIDVTKAINQWLTFNTSLCKKK